MAQHTSGHRPGHDAPDIKKAAGGYHTTTATTSQNALDSIAARAQAKRFAPLRAQFALKGHALYKSGPGDGPGPVSYLAERWGLVRHLPTLDDAERFLAQIGRAS
jgi:hypothetical protein